MLRLVRVEIRRLLARRLVRVFGLVMFVGMLLLNGGQFVQADNRSLAPQSGVVVIEGSDGEPGQVVFTGEEPRFHFVSEGRDQVKAAGIVAAIAAFMIGTSFIGAEWMAGTMQALLFWEPRRARVVVAKATALALVAVVAALAFQLLEFGLSYLTAEFRGTFEGAGSVFYRDLFLTSLRVSSLAAFSGLLAFAIAGLTRHTAAALGIAFAYFAIIEGVLRGWRPGWTRYLISSQFVALVEKRLELDEPGRFVNGEFVERVFVLTMGRAALTLAVYLALALGAMIVLFVRRDVT